jgi:hypothetical protein
VFQNGISYQDIKQGAINDCFFLAGLSQTAFRSLSTIENMFYDVRKITYNCIDVPRFTSLVVCQFYFDG